MKLGFVSAILPDLSFEEVVTFASEEKFHNVELMCWPVGKADRRYAGITHINVAELSAPTIEYIKNTVEEKKIQISALGYYPNPLDEDLNKREVYISHIKQVVKAASELGIGIVNTFVGRMQTQNIGENLREFTKVWGPIIPYAEELNVKIGIENCPMYFTNDEWPAGKNLAYSPAIWEQMFEIIPSSHFGLNYDPSHLLWQQINYIKPLYDFKDRILHVHIKDAQIHQDKLERVGILATPLEYHSPKLPGLGDIEWGKFFSALTNINYKGAVSIEVEDRAFEESLESRKHALRLARNYVGVYTGLRE